MIVGVERGEVFEGAWADGDGAPTSGAGYRARSTTKRPAETPTRALQTCVRAGSSRCSRTQPGLAPVGGHGR